MSAEQEEKEAVTTATTVTVACVWDICKIEKLKILFLAPISFTHDVTGYLAVLTPYVHMHTKRYTYIHNL